MSENIITINATNVITIWIIALVGLVLMGTLGRMVRRKANQDAV